MSRDGGGGGGGGGDSALLPQPSRGATLVRRKRSANAAAAQSPSKRACTRHLQQQACGAPLTPASRTAVAAGVVAAVDAGAGEVPPLSLSVVFDALTDGG
ncbi:MAG: hypothetical protein ACK4ZJ_17035, partial [Allorhizobium sp.]